jgi:hypothetical protein
MSHKGRHRKPDLEPNPLLRRSFLFGGGVLATATAVGMVSAFDSSVPAPRRSATLERAGSSTSAARRAWARLAPRVYTTREWRARSPEREADFVSGPPRYIVIHHTFTPNVSDVSVARGFRLSRGIQNHHMGRGWSDTGQHFTISRGGHVMEGRTGSLDATLRGGYMVGTHARQANDYSVGIECEGTYNSVLPPARLMAALVRTCAWLCAGYDLDPREVIVPHMKFNDTDCCGHRFAPTLPSLRAKVAKAMRG